MPMRETRRARPLAWLLTMACVLLGACIQEQTAGDARAHGMPAAQPGEPVPLTYFGLHIHHADDGTAWPPVPFGSWRLWDSRVNWPELEPERGRWDFKRLDKDVALAELTGTDILLPLARSPRWASSRPDEKSAYGPGQAAEPRDMEDWRGYVRTVGQRYRGRIRFYEIWNEASDKAFFSGDVDTLINLTREAARILKQIDPANQVVAPGMAGLGYHMDYLDRFLARGGKDWVDVIGYHFYVPTEAPEAMLPLIRQVRRIMVRNGVSDKPLWNTETGWWIANADRTPPGPGIHGNWRLVGAGESDWLVARALILARGEGVGRYFWYSWDHPSFALMEPTARTLKPGGQAYGTVATWLLGAVVDPCTADGPVWSCRVRRAGAADGWIAWSAQGGGQLVWPGPSGSLRRSTLNGGDSSMVVEKGTRLPVDERPVLFQPVAADRTKPS